MCESRRPDKAADEIDIIQEIDIEALLARYQAHVPPILTARQMAEPPKLPSAARAYRQWWAEQRDSYCPESCTGSDRTTRLSWLAFIEAEMADAFRAQVHAELMNSLTDGDVSDAAELTAIAALLDLQDRAMRLLAVVWL